MPNWRRRLDWRAIQGYYDAGHTWRETRNEFGVSFAALAKARKRGDLRLRDGDADRWLAIRKGRIRNYHPDLDSSYFARLDMPDKAYWFGFLCADGYVLPGNRRCSLSLSSRDEDQLDRFVAAVGADPALKKRMPARMTVDFEGRGMDINTGEEVALTIADPEFVGHLVRQGCFHLKSEKVALPFMGVEHLDLCFLAGYYDGNGCDGVISTGSPHFVAQVKERFGLPFRLVRRVSKDGYETWCLNLGIGMMRKMWAAYPASMPRKRTDDLKYGVGRTKPAGKGSFPDRPERRKFDVPDAELVAMARKASFAELGRRFGVSDNAVRKRLVRIAARNVPALSR